MLCKFDRYLGLKSGFQAVGMPHCSPPFTFSLSKSVKLSGLSLIELLVTLSIFVILIATSAPVLKTLIVNNRVATAADELYGSIMLARSEAIKRRHPVALCSTVDNRTCDEANTGWQSGWLVFTDAAKDDLLNDDDVLLRRVSGQAQLLSIVWNRGFSLGFNSQGQTSKAGTFKVCDQTGSSPESITIVISMAGRMRTEEQGACS